MPPGLEPLTVGQWGEFSTTVLMVLAQIIYFFTIFTLMMPATVAGLEPSNVRIAGVFSTTVLILLALFI
jgi:hypothetical protein